MGSLRYEMHNSRKGTNLCWDLQILCTFSLLNGSEIQKSASRGAAGTW